MRLAATSTPHRNAWSETPFCVCSRPDWTKGQTKRVSHRSWTLERQVSGLFTDTRQFVHRYVAHHQRLHSMPRAAGGLQFQQLPAGTVKPVPLFVVSKVRLHQVTLTLVHERRPRFRSLVPPLHFALERFRIKRPSTNGCVLQFVAAPPEPRGKMGFHVMCGTRMVKRFLKVGS